MTLPVSRGSDSHAQLRIQGIMASASILGRNPCLKYFDDSNRQIRQNVRAHMAWVWTRNRAAPRARAQWDCQRRKSWSLKGATFTVDFPLAPFPSCG